MSYVHGLENSLLTYKMSSNLSTDSIQSQSKAQEIEEMQTVLALKLTRFTEIDKITLNLMWKCKQYWL